MFLECLIGQEYFDRDLYQLLLLEVEANNNFFRKKFLHIYFERQTNQKIAITEIAHFKDDDELHLEDRKGIGRRERYRIYDNAGVVCLTLFRLDRSGYYASIRPGQETLVMEGVVTWGAELPSRPPMNEAELRRAFRDLAGCYETANELADS